MFKSIHPSILQEFIPAQYCVEFLVCENGSLTFGQTMYLLPTPWSPLEWQEGYILLKASTSAYRMNTRYWHWNIVMAADGIQLNLRTSNFKSGSPRKSLRRRKKKTGEWTLPLKCRRSLTAWPGFASFASQCLWYDIPPLPPPDYATQYDACPNRKSRWPGCVWPWPGFTWLCMVGQSTLRHALTSILGSATGIRDQRLSVPAMHSRKVCSRRCAFFVLSIHGNVQSRSCLSRLCHNDFVRIPLSI